jgi:hypothetical protein
LEITFAKKGPRDYQVVVRRDDGVLLNVRSFDRTLRLPHDIAHFVVETELGLEHGFWGLLAAGVLFNNMRVAAGRVRPRARERSRSVLKEVGQHPIEAEVLVSVMQGIAEERADEHWRTVQARLDAVWKPRKSQRGPISHDEVRRVCRELRVAEEKWRALSVGQSITVVWGSHSRRLQQSCR